MGYGGQPMKVVKANRALLKKRNTFKKVKEMFLDTADGAPEQMDAARKGRAVNALRRAVLGG